MAALPPSSCHLQMVPSCSMPSASHSGQPFHGLEKAQLGAGRSKNHHQLECKQPQAGERERWGGVEERGPRRCFGAAVLPGQPSAGVQPDPTCVGALGAPWRAGAGPCPQQCHPPGSVEPSSVAVPLILLLFLFYLQIFPLLPACCVCVTPSLPTAPACFSFPSPNTSSLVLLSLHRSLLLPCCSPHHHRLAHLLSSPPPLLPASPHTLLSPPCPLLSLSVSLSLTVWGNLSVSTHGFHYLLAERGEVLHSSVIVCRSKRLLMAALPSRTEHHPQPPGGGRTRACRYLGD